VAFCRSNVNKIFLYINLADHCKHWRRRIFPKEHAKRAAKPAAGSALFTGDGRTISGAAPMPLWLAYLIIVCAALWTDCDTVRALWALS